MKDIKSYCETSLNSNMQIESNNLIPSPPISLHDTNLNNFLKAFVGWLRWYDATHHYVNEMQMHIELFMLHQRDKDEVEVALFCGKLDGLQAEYSQEEAEAHYISTRLRS